MPPSTTSRNQIEPSWRPWQLMYGHRIPQALLGWLQDEGSLTRRVMSNCPGFFHLRVVSQRRGRPFRSERQVLAGRSDGAALIREVVLCCGEDPWVFARTLIPVATLRGGARRLAYLRERPLGAVLFADADVRRGDVEVAELAPRHALFRLAGSCLGSEPGVLWARRTLFFVQDRPLLVNEVFLPGLPGCS